MKKNILLRTNFIVCLIIIVGFLLTALLSYRANFSASLKNIEQVSTLTSEGIYHQMATTFTKPINISLTMANDSLLKEFLSHETSNLDDERYIGGLSEYLGAYQIQNQYDSVFLVSTATNRYYNFNGLDRVLERGDPENVWYYTMLEGEEHYSMNVDNDEVSGAGDAITVFVNCKIFSDSGSVLGIVGVGVRINHLQALLQNYQDEFSINAYLVDEQGTIQISTSYTGYEGVELFEVDQYGDEVREQILGWYGDEQDRAFWAVDEATGSRKSFIVTRYLPELQWHLVVEQNTGVLVQQLNRQLAVTMIVIAAIIGVILFVITHVIRSFNSQIVSLTQTVERERSSIFEKATEELYENIYELDITHNCSANQATEDYFVSLGAPVGTPFDKALHIIAEQQIKAEFRQGYIDTFSPGNVQKAFEKGCETLRYDFMITKDGENYYWMRITARLVRWESDGSLHMLVYRQNIDAEKRREKQMLELAQTDEMTGLLTKSAARRCVEHELETGTAGLYTFFMLDIDNFKQANDLFGHAFGDAVIQQFTQILRQSFRRDDILGRVGGDEFAAFLPVPDEPWTVNKARELSAALDRTVTHDGKSWHMSASIGVVAALRETGADHFYECADAALYETKKRGKNGYTLYREPVRS